MENIVEKEARRFSRIFFRAQVSNNLENLKSRLTDKLYSFNREKDKLFFLSILRKEIELEKNEHEKSCNTPNCRFSDERSTAIFVVDQEMEDISEHFEFKPKPEDEFSSQERADLHNRLNEIADKLNDLGLGQEIIFEEIDDLKENFNLGKKNWFQLLKGKLFDLGIKKVLEKTIIDNLYSELSDGFENIKSMIGN